MFHKDVRNQYYATICANLMSLAYGCSCGWASANLVTLQSNETPLQAGKLTVHEASWVGSLLCIGGLTGNCVYGWVTEKYGRKKPLLLNAFPQIISWLLIIYAKDVTHLCVARFLNGFSGGGVFILIPLYVTEISSDCVRGNLGSLFMFFSSGGILLAFICGYYLSYTATMWVILSISIIFLIGFMWFPESPLFLMKQGRKEEAEKSLRFYRRQHEIPDFRKKLMGNIRTKDDLTLSDFSSLSARRSLIIGFSLIALNQFCGCFAMINYTATIFSESGSSVSPNMSAIIIGVIALFGAYFATLLVERAGRKILLGISLTGVGVGQLTLGIYFYMKLNDMNIESISWLPIFAFSFIIFIAGWGILTVPFLYITEILPDRIRSFGTSLCMSLSWLFAFLMVKYFPIVSNLFGMYVCMFIFSVASFVGTAFIIFVLPETKGKSFDEIMEMLGR